ncbi:MAG: biotin-dependent carboxyltransferase family protein [Beijerinckiaceae bacterium]
MNPLLLVRSPGLHTTVQDLGRTGYGDIGVPTSGGLDAVALRLANALVGNPPGAALIEMLVNGPALEVVADAVRVAIVGGTGTLVVQGAEKRQVSVGRGLRLVKGDLLNVGAVVGTSCAYLAVEGGLHVPLILGSASTFTRGALGGFDGRVLRTGDVLEGPLADVSPRAELELAAPVAAGDEPIRVVLGPQDDHFTQGAIEALLSGTYIVSPQADRMGFRLEGPMLAHTQGYNIASDGIVSGSIQVPGSGQPIVLMRDYQTIGGYPKMATVVSHDISRLGRRGPGAKVRFVAVNRDEAEAIHREEEAAIAARIADLREARDTADLNVAALYDANLIDGIVSARE